MLTSTETLARTRIRVSPGAEGGRCRVRTAVTASDSTASCVRPVLVHHDRVGARISLVPEGALLLSGDAVEIDVTVEAGARLDLVEPGGTVAFAMRGGRARWDVRLQVAAGAALTWAGEPFVVSAGADVTRSTRVRVEDGGRLALREVLVLGRYGEAPGSVHQRTEVVDGDGRPLLVEDLPLDDVSAPALLGGRRVMATVLSLGGAPDLEPGDETRYDLECGGRLWRRLGGQTHEACLDTAWQRARACAR